LFRGWKAKAMDKDLWEEDETGKINLGKRRLSAKKEIPGGLERKRKTPISRQRAHGQSQPKEGPGGGEQGGARTWRIERDSRQQFNAKKRFVRGWRMSLFGKREWGNVA